MGRETSLEQSLIYLSELSISGRYCSGYSLSSARRVANIQLKEVIRKGGGLWLFEVFASALF